MSELLKAEAGMKRGILAPGNVEDIRLSEATYSRVVQKPEMLRLS
jgi:hypothetical protein